jgi:hypothetical protein
LSAVRTGCHINAIHLRVPLLRARKNDMLGSERLFLAEDALVRP